MKAEDIKHLLSAVHLLQAARMEIKKISPSGREEIQQPQLIDELIKLEDEIGNKWLDARRAEKAGKTASPQDMAYFAGGYSEVPPDK